LVLIAIALAALAAGAILLTPLLGLTLPLGSILIVLIVLILALGPVLLGTGVSPLALCFHLALVRRTFGCLLASLLSTLTFFVLVLRALLPFTLARGLAATALVAATALATLASR